MALATLTIDVVAKLANLERDMGKVAHLSEQSAQRMQRAFDTAGKAFVAMGGALAGAGLAAGIKGIIDSADEFAKLSQKIGISVEDLAGFDHAAKLSGISTEQFAQGVKQTARYMADYGDKLQKAGITATDAKGVIIQLADAFQKMPDGAQKTAIAMEIMGKSGADMIPLLNGGGAALKAMLEEGQRLNPVTTEMAKNAERFNDALARLDASARTVGITLGNVVVGPMADWLEANVEAVRISGGFAEMMRLFVFNLDAMTTEKPREEIRRLTAEMEKYQSSSSFGQFLQSPFGGLEKDHQKKIEFLKYLERQQAMANASRLGDYRDARDLGAHSKSVASASNLSSILGSGATAKTPRQSDLDKFLERIQKDRDAEYYKNDSEEAMWAAVAKNADLSAEAVKKYDEALKKSAESLYASTDAGQFDKMLADIAKAEEAFAAGLISPDQLDAITAKLMDVGDTGKDAFSALTQAVEGWGKQAANTFAEFAIDGKGSISDLFNHMAKEFIAMETYPMFRDIMKGGASWLRGLDFGSLFSLNALGGVYSGAGISAYSGQVVSSPTVFPFASGIGLMGEAGPEAILPLSRGADGRLGVSGGGSNVQVNVINNASGTRATARERNEGGNRIIDVLVEQIKTSIAGDISDGRGAIPAAMSNSYGLNRAPGAY